jgi:Caulimovirus viroplasmin
MNHTVNKKSIIDKYKQRKQQRMIFHSRVLLLLFLLVVSSTSMFGPCRHRVVEVSSFTITKSLLSTTSTFFSCNRRVRSITTSTNKKSCTTTRRRSSSSSGLFILSQSLQQQQFCGLSATIGSISIANFFTTSVTRMAPSKKFYAVAVGRIVGVFNTWDEAEVQVWINCFCCFAVAVAVAVGNDIRLNGFFFVFVFNSVGFINPITL